MKSRRDDLIKDIVRSLTNDYDMKTKGKYLERGVCPSCGKKTLWTWSGDPSLIRCNRKNKCGYEVDAKELYPTLFEELSKRYPPTAKQPNATADSYLQLIRGFNLSQIKGWYEQNEIKDFKNSSFWPTVRFYLNDEKTVYWERIIERVSSYWGDKANFKGQYGGKWWQPPTMQIKPYDEVYIVEGIFDCIALFLNGYKAVTPMTCGNYPKALFEKYKDDHVTWVYAFDNDDAGRKFNLKHVNQLRKAGQDVTCAMPNDKSKKIDWNDRHQEGKLTKKDMELYRYWGECLIAETAKDKALIMYHYTEKSLFTFSHGKRFYGFDLNTDKYNKFKTDLEKQYQDKLKEGEFLSDEQLEEIKENALAASNTLRQISNCVPDFLYTQQNPLTDELFYFVRVSFPDGRVTKNTMTGSQLSGAADFRKRMLGMASGAIFKGSAKHHAYMLDQWMKRVKQVETVPYVGYDAQHDIYVYPQFAVKDGKVFELNKEDFIETPKLSIKSMYHTVSLDCTLDDEKYNDEWFQMMVRAWGNKAIVALAFFVGSLFVQQIRAKQDSFPFLELVGDPGTGKTTLISFLWKLFGRSGYEGINPRANKGTTAFMARAMGQISNLPVVLIEGDNSKDKHNKASVDWSDFKDLYNGRGLRGRGMKTQGNETYEPDFNGALVIAQNFPVDSEPAILERITQCYFKAEDNSMDTLDAVRGLAGFESENLSYFLVHCLKNQKKIMDTYFKQQPKFEAALLANESIKTQRLTLTHSQLMGLVSAIQHVVPITKDQVEDTHITLETMAEDREIYIAREHPVVEQFFDVVAYIQERLSLAQGTILSINHGKSNLAVRLNEVYEKASYFNQQLPNINDLKNYLRYSKRFVAYKSVSSQILDKTVKCWVFDNA